jgi:hypothetical protein
MKPRTPSTRSLLSRLLAMGALCAASTLSAVAQPPNPSNPIKLTKGVVSDSRTGKPVEGGRIFVYQGSSSEPVAQSKINPSTGAFQVVLAPSTEYRFVLRSDRYLPSETMVKTPGGNNYEEVVRNLTMEAIPVGKTLFSGRLFDAGAAVLRSSDELAKAIAFMKQSQAAMLKITVIPDVAGRGAAKATKPPAKPKKGKKGAAAQPQTGAASATLTTSTTAEDPLTTLAWARVQALKALMQKEGISLTRITWEALTTPSQLKSVAGRKENVVIAINGIDVEEVEED